MELTVVMPCLNEAETVATCVTKAIGFMREHGINGEVVVADNGSTDGSQQLARDAGARVVHVEEKGYGNALMGGIRAARGKYVIMGDADDSYDFTNLMPFIKELRDGADLVMGNRFKGGIAPGAMPPLHRYLGNPVLSFIGRLFFNSPVGDFHCGLRGFRRDSILRLGLQTGGMEFASEMVVKATLQGLDIREVPTTLSPDGRSRPPHLRSWRDGWRHLRFLLLYSPRWLFLIPGLVLMAIGLIMGIALSTGPVFIGELGFDVDTLVGASAMVVIGYQAVLFAIFTKVYAAEEGFLPQDKRVRRLVDVITLERGLLVGGLLAVAGFGGLIASLVHWGERGFGELIPAESLRLVVPSATAFMMSCQTIFATLFVSILGIRRSKETAVDVAASAAEEAAEAVARDSSVAGTAQSA
ncbi:dolichol-P-glucose synthetase [Thermobispora bispora]|uniref:Glycosyl transferase family 2 n=1 Tax=Thermobispora bispora (strain ATCC 19993 / DSM 43833 / CBS 139.67 / JCM 10125 / KCTC 9307 / NBRC 14880 / R51) TaxID=469371 RepID=D6Y8D0_THEBD|nr:glycosyltransferase family 2 protein [Thermobispora bispora]ADG89866.1 glycosyl transferase family 2 [Thermobispora bispora DSM 43833]MDI9582300.1 glycosyltransferase family 2 protein [Thermobispora sp.]